MAGEALRDKPCFQCGAPFGCGAGTAAESACWCNGFPPLKTLVPGGDCLCPRCLREAVTAEGSE